MSMSTSTQMNPRVGVAGRSGKDVRSDLQVTVEARDSGGIELVVTSKVELYYGDAIRTQTLDVLRQLGVEHARVIVEDYGALPFVIAARIEAAARRAGFVAGTRALPTLVTKPAASAKDRLRRSRLYLPGSEPKYFVNASLHGADAIILDLEDSVRAAEKDSSRILVRNALRAVNFASCERMVRINQLPLGLEDLDEIVAEQPDLILIPKVETAAQIEEADRHLRALEFRAGIHQPIWIMPILESAMGIENAFAIARASDRICAITIGLEDYTADMGVVKTASGAESMYARTRMVNAAKAAGVQAIDSVFSDVADAEGLAAWGEASRALGFEGMGCIHPSQIPIIHKAYSPQPVEIEKALKIVAAYEEAQQRGLGVVSLGSKMIDPPVVNRALKLVARARRMGLVPEASMPTTKEAK